MITIFEQLRRLTNETEATVIGLVAATIPWLAPLIPAYVAYQNMRHVLLFDPWLSFIGAAVVEFLGLSSIHTTIQFWDYNRTRRKTDGTAPVYIAAAVGVFYLAVVLTVNVILDDAPVDQLIAKALLSLISVPAGVTLAIRAQHSGQLLQLEAEKRERREARAAAVSLTVSQETKQETIRPEETARQRMGRLWKPGMKPTELSSLAAVSKGYASKYINNGAMKHYQMGGN